MRNIERRILGLLFGLLALSAAVSSAMGAGGDLIWDKTIDPSTGLDDAAYDIARDGTGIYVVGYDKIYGLFNSEWRIEKRSLTTGDVIWSKTSNPSAKEDVALSVAVHSTGVYIVGYDSSPSSGYSQWRIEKRSLTTGDVIWFKTSKLAYGPDVATGVAVHSTGVYVVGYISSPSIGDNQWRIEKRSLTTGDVIWFKTINPSAYGDYPTGVAVHSTGVYIVGYDSYSYKVGYNTRWRIEKRSLATGNLIWSKTFNPSARQDAAMDVAVHSTGVYIVGYDGVLGSSNDQWRIQKRNMTTGNLIWSKTFNPSAYEDRAMGVAVSGAGVYIVGYSSFLSSADTLWTVQKRSFAGNPVWTKYSNPTAGWDFAEGAAVDSTGVYIVGHCAFEWWWRIEKRQP